MFRRGLDAPAVFLGVFREYRGEAMTYLTGLVATQKLDADQI
jgi:hypothetical protein